MFHHLYNQLSNRKHRRAARAGPLRSGAKRPAGFTGLESLEGRALLSGVNPNEAVNTSLTPADLAQSLVGAGVSVSNVSFTGNSASTGSFTFNDPTVLGFSQGIMLSSGSAVDVVGPNLTDYTSTDFALPGDANLDALSGFTTFDASVLEFDFTPTANQVVFSYVFASDEYPEWVNTPYNDVFAFFVNGTNYATVRQTAGDPTAPFVPVAVNTINAGNLAYYPDIPAARPDLFRPNYNDPSGGPSLIDLEQDGLTTVLTFQAPVTPGVSNHMKLAIADASDGIYDSAVFIQAGSLVSNENPVADLSVSPESGAAPLTVTAAIEGEDPNGLPITYSIDWGDGTSTSTGPLDLPVGESEKTALTTHTYTTGGTYIVTLTVSNGSLSGTSIEDIHVSGGGGTSTAPSVTTDPIDQTVVEGEQYTFTAAASGEPTPTVQWQVSTDLGETFNDIIGATGINYLATASLGDNGNLYHAVFTNSEGSATTGQALLTVTPLPTDTTPPIAPGVALADDTGASITDKITSAGDLALSNIEPGASVEYSIDNGDNWSSFFTAIEGENTLLVRQIDEAGNESDATPFSFTLDTTLPAAPGVALTDDTGVSLTDKITSAGALTLSDVESDAGVEYSIDSGDNWSSSFTAVEGINSVLLRQIDLAGNVSDAGAISFTLDTTAPRLSPSFSSAAQPFLVGAAVTVSANATDDSGIASQTSGLTVNTSTAGGKIVGVIATDTAGNSASTNVSYVVGYGAINVSPVPGSTFKRKVGIPVSFQLVNANGLISDQTATSLVPAIKVAFDGLAPVSAKYNKKTKSFTAGLKTSQPTPGVYNLSIRVILGGIDVTSVLIPINVV